MATYGASSAADAGKFVLRLVLSILLLFHGVSKIFSGPGHIVGMVAKAGMPEAFGYLVYVGEVVAPLLVLLGLWTRLGALLIAGNMIVAVFLAHRGELFTMTKTGGWALELQAFYFGVAVAIVLLGAGRYSVGGAGGRWN